MPPPPNINTTGAASSTTSYPIGVIPMLSTSRGGGGDQLIYKLEAANPQGIDTSQDVISMTSSGYRQSNTLAGNFIIQQPDSKISGKKGSESTVWNSRHSRVQKSCSWWYRY